MYPKYPAVQPGRIIHATSR